MGTRKARTGSGRPVVGQTTLRQTGPSWASPGPARANPGVGAGLIEAMESKAHGFRYYGIRVMDDQPPPVGPVLPNSWHNASECDWLEEDMELKGTCAFEVQDIDRIGQTIEVALGFWPESRYVLLVGSNRRGDAAEAGGLPEDGAVLLREPIVLAVVETADWRLRTNPAMVFAIFSQHTGRILGTARGRDRADAMGRVRSRLHEFPGHRTTQDILLYPMMNLTPVQRWIATSGLGMIAL